MWPAAFQGGSAKHWSKQKSRSGPCWPARSIDAAREGVHCVTDETNNSPQVMRLNGFSNVAEAAGFRDPLHEPRNQVLAGAERTA